MGTSYDKLYDLLLSKFQDYQIPLMEIDDVRDMLSDYITPAISRFNICRKDLNDRDGFQFNEDLSDVEVEILSNYMLVTYLDSNYIRVPTLLKVHLSSRDFNSYSPANMLERLMGMRTRYTQENESLVTQYSWLNSGYDMLTSLKRK